MFNVQQLRDLIIKPTLNDLVMYSKEAEELLVFTCAIESRGGTYIKQINGKALGVYQMEPDTYYDIWQNYITHKKDLLLMMITNFDCVRVPNEHRLIYDLRYATAMTRIHYSRVSEVLPKNDDVRALWNYYKQYYNTYQGAAKQDESVRKYLALLNT